MSISRQNLTIVIATLKSEKIIHECINSIDKNVPIIVVENSNDSIFKNELEKKYNNLTCVLTEENLGMGTANNIGIKLSKTDYVYVINPDVVLKTDTLDKIFLASNNLKDFSILTPINENLNFPNWRRKERIGISSNTEPLEVDSIDGFSMLLNKKKFFHNNYFDENFFLYLENEDLCLRTKKEDGLIFIIPSSKVIHLGASSVNLEYKKEVEISRNWHWLWSKFYYNKKHFGFIKAFLDGFPSFFSSIIKYLFYLITNNNLKKKIYLSRASGFFNALIGKQSWYRPNLDN